MNWPALSPDLNPIEHLWDEIQRRLNEEQPSPTTAAELWVALQRVWALIPMTTMMLGPPQSFLSIMPLSLYHSPRLLHNLVLPSAVEMQ
jgi:hypothetical protein